MTPSRIAIVGAGPAGSRAAWGLARAGARVTLFDPSHPREKPCGGGLTGRAQALAAEVLGSAMPAGVAVGSLRFQSGLSGGRASALVPVEGDGSGPRLLVVRRQELDGALLAAALDAGAELVRERVVDVAIDPSAVTLTTAHATRRADVVLGADGVGSVVRRRLLAPFTRHQISLATGFYVRGATSDEAVVSCAADPPGYLWAFPRPDHLAVGMCAKASRVTATELRSAVAEWIRQARLPEGTALRPYSWPIPSLPPAECLRQQPAGPRWMLLGDAAGLADPLTREGIFFALRSGQLAAEALGADPDPAAGYVTRLRDEVYAELARAAALAAGFFGSRFTDLMVDALERSAPVRAVMADLVAGRQPYRSLRRRLLATCEFGLAWRLLMLQVRGRSRPQTPQDGPDHL